MPFPVTKEVLERGRERYTFSARPATRAWVMERFVPFSGIRAQYHRHSTSCACKKRHSGYLYDVITNGFGIMPDYASQDRRASLDIRYVARLALSQIELC